MKPGSLICLILLIGIHGNAQKLSLNFDVGYGFNLAPASIGEGGYAVRISEFETEFKSIIYSHGKGLDINSEIEYFPQKNFGIGLGVGYLNSSKVNTLFDRKDFIRNTEYSASMLRFSPFIKLKFGTGKLAFYSKLGYLMGVLGEIKKESTSMDDADNIYLTKNIYNEGVSHGAIAGFGIEYKLSKLISLSSEIRIFAQSYGPKKEELVVYTINGENKLPELEPGNIHINYVDNYVHQWNSNGSTDFSKPLTELRIFYPFSSIGLNVGIQYKLIKRK